jgi:hypothetical protein
MIAQFGSPAVIEGESRRLGWVGDWCPSGDAIATELPCTFAREYPLKFTRV